MSEGKHTPGPLIVHRAPKADNTGGFDYCVVDSDEKIIAEFFEHVGFLDKLKKSYSVRPALANATLYAAAPEMLEALEAAQQEFLGLSAYLETCDPAVMVENLPTLVASLKRKQEQAEAAIAKLKVSNP